MAALCSRNMQLPFTAATGKLCIDGLYFVLLSMQVGCGAYPRILLFCTAGTVCTACESKSCRGVDVAAPCHARTAGEIQLGHVILLAKTTAETVVVSGRFSQKERTGY